MSTVAFRCKPHGQPSSGCDADFCFLSSTSYIFPIAVRTRMAELFQDKTVVRWWLPDDHGFTPILQNVRAFADERNAAATSAQTKSLQDMKNVFAALHLGSDGAPVAGTGSSMLSPRETGKDNNVKPQIA